MCQASDKSSLVTEVDEDDLDVIKALNRDDYPELNKMQNLMKSINLSLSHHDVSNNSNRPKRYNILRKKFNIVENKIRDIYSL